MTERRTERRPRAHERLLGRILLLVLLPTLVVILTTVGFNSYRTWHRLHDTLEEELVDATNLAVAVIEAENRAAITVAHTVALAQTNGLFGQRERTLDLLRAVVVANPQLQGCFIAYEPNADVIDAVALETSIPREAMSAEGRFIPYFRRDAGVPGGIRLEPLVDMDLPESLWYHGVKVAFQASKRSEPMITKPYSYEGVLLIEFIYPLVMDGRFKGISGVDRTLAGLQRDLRQIQERTGVDLMLETRGFFVATTLDGDGLGDVSGGRGALQATLVKDSPFGPLFAESLDRRGRTFEAVDPILGDTCVYSAATVPTGGWTLIARKPKDELYAALASTMMTNLLTALVGIALVVVVILAFAFAIRRRVGRALVAAEQIASGDLTQAIVVDTARDETGDLVRGLSRMSEHLNTLVGKVQQESIRINSTANELAATSRQQEEAVSGFGASTSEIAAAAKQIASTTTELVQTMDAVDDLSRETSTLAQSGRAGLSTMEQSMRRLDDATRSIAEKLATINEKAAGITGMVTTISRVADQTNLLSVNAAIEAEKAGEYGAGFLVVAREIRRLADQTGGATLDIERMVQQMQSAVSSGVMEMDRFADAVRHGVGEVERIAAQFTKIIEQVAESNERFTVVNEGMKSQSEGAAQISEAMTTLTAGARQTMEATTGFSQAARDLQDAIAGLKSSISIFRLRQDSGLR